MKNKLMRPGNVNRDGHKCLTALSGMLSDEWAARDGGGTFNIHHTSGVAFKLLLQPRVPRCWYGLGDASQHMSWGADATSRETHPDHIGPGWVERFCRDLADAATAATQPFVERYCKECDGGSFVRINDCPHVTP